MYEQLRLALNEKDVENTYRSEIKKLIPDAKITSPLNIDGLLEYKNVRSLLEFKFDVDLKSKNVQANIFTQMIYYFKRFELNGKKLPTTLFVGDNNECFALEAKHIYKFLNRDINWNLPPSKAHQDNQELIRALVQDVDIAPMVFDINNTLKLRDIINQLQDLSEGRVSKVIINQQNIVEAFKYWKEYVLLDDSLSVQEEASLFIYCLVDLRNTYLHPHKPNTLVSNFQQTFTEVHINSDVHRSFFSHFEQDYKTSEIDLIISSKDRLVEEVLRRREGEFYTPTIWTYESEKIISNALGLDWKEKYIVWDCCSGLNNLTRDFKFSNLYCSTINIEDIRTVNKMRYNPEATIFQFDFLNDSFNKLPQELLNQLKENKPIVFYINPPFATAGERKSKSKTNKIGTSDTIAREIMREFGFGRSSEQLYAQFLFQIFYIKKFFKLSNVYLCFYSKPTFLVSPSFKSFREKFFKEFKFIDGMLLRANNFSDVSDSWGVSFTVWSSGKTTTNEFNLIIKSINQNNMTIADYGEKTMFNSDNNSASQWAREPINKLEKVDSPQLSNPINVKQKGYGKVIQGGLGYMHNNSNNIMQSDRYVGLYSSAFSDGHGIPITKDNLMRIVALFAARKSVRRTWINDKDEFLIPNTQTEAYQLWNNDALIYSLFNSSSNQSSLRKVLYKGKEHDIYNQFFFLSKEEMLTLSDDYHFHEMYRDTKHYNKNSYVYYLIQQLSFSDKANKVLNEARELIIASMQYREECHYKDIRFNLDAWDAGWYQLRLGIFNQVESLKDKYSEFTRLYKELETDIQIGVYEHGFLKK
ncbi:hypothetical protein E3U55_15785 [Filobacillus milosensis]|uniref:Uncharacterized protein n=1 Tax=Filobacillus milosensis TaxID=94137 RepID=A0A4Y8IC91_9BACI|nr:hypothetical protein [Filobacillus milosensis]TFB13580.1 hypothetical protein E3U55_15785 [Filobacillus milosensis]